MQTILEVLLAMKNDAEQINFIYDNLRNRSASFKEEFFELKESIRKPQKQKKIGTKICAKRKLDDNDTAGVEIIDSDEDMQRREGNKKKANTTKQASSLKINDIVPIIIIN